MPSPTPDYESARRRTVALIAETVSDQRVLDAMGRVPRERFVPPGTEHLAYEDGPLPIGAGQTISQPLIVAMMTEALELRGAERVLEVGAGSGYQAAVLSLLAARVVTVERVPGLARSAATRLAALGYANVEVHEADGGVLGWPAAAPYDAIIVAAAGPQAPPSLVAQLGPTGRLVMPVGGPTEQELLVFWREGGRLRPRSLGPCRFVPLIGDEAWMQDPLEGLR
ncbi:MAG: protein-L-isoaspartate(D-aspartate) O-methyltransferase [Dehalococcoidia bacterium]|nr:protein-L-isoaspartate(D-aspartate) O-methyltransferase [Dehalococcoidia bacterium]